jgi:acetyl-CoA acetyltransferase family protein
MTKRNVVLVEGLRTPFRRSGSDYLGLTSYDLARLALRGLLSKSGLEPEQIGLVVLGNVVQNVSTSNVARDAALGAGFSHRTPAFTVTMACISANQAVVSAAEAIRAGQTDIAIAGGVEVLSDAPPQFPLEVRKRLYESQKYGSPLEYRKLLQGLSPSDLLPKAPRVAEYATGETMGESADKLAAAFGVSRQEQDAYALRSHRRAAAATEAGKLTADLLPTAVPPKFNLLTQDNTVRGDSSPEKLASLKPVFVKPFGTVTAGNASPLTDGASAVLLMEEETARALGYTPLARLGAYTFVAQDPGEELLLGPAYATPQVLERAGVTLADVDVLELHEAFAGQVLAVLRALGSDTFAREKLGRDSAVGEIDPDKLNAWGGSLSLGHPFGATGTRLLTMAARRLHDEDGQLALLTACAAGGLGHALLLERVGRA